MTSGENTIKNNRQYFWDNIKGLLILLVVFGHFVLDASLLADNSVHLFNIVWKFIYIFHMPAFVFISGYWGRKVADADPEKRRKNIIFIGLAYIILQALFIIYSFSIGKEIDLFVPLYSSWYLLALFIWRIVTVKVNRPKLLFVLSVVLSLIIGFLPQFDRVLALGRIIAFYPFYLAGFLFLPDEISELRASIRKKKSKFIVVLVLLLLVFVGCIYLSSSKPTLEILTMGAYRTLFDLVFRVEILLVSFAVILSLVVLIPNRRFAFFTTAGKNSLPIYFFHRFIVLFFFEVCFKYFVYESPILLIFIFILLSVLVCIVFSFEKVNSALKDFLTWDNSKITYKQPIYLVLLISIMIILVVQGNVFVLEKTNSDLQRKNIVANDLSNVISDSQKEKFDNSYKILFAGDLILLEDQVKNAYNGTEYDFSDMFFYTHEYIEDADLAIGVFEGPMAGADILYSQSNYADGKYLYLNFPDSFCEDVKDAGFDLVTLANNHMHDCGTEGALRTLDIMENAGLAYVGLYRDENEKRNERIKIVEDEGIRFAILSYTINYNFTSDEDVFGELNYLSSFLAAPDSEYYDIARIKVKEDFELAKTYNPDFIIVLPHMGTQFIDSPDDYQNAWCNYFIELGADIILSDHTHSVMPASIISTPEKDVFVGYCPGNYANIYREYNGDCSILTEVYIDKENKTLVGGSIIPMWITANADGNYRPIPVYDIVNDDEVRKTITTTDLARVEEVQRHITSTVLGVEIDISAARKRYYFDNSGYLREKAEPLVITEEMQKGIFYRTLDEANNVCFLGDSITCGSRNFGYPWYEPIEGLVSGNLSSYAVGGFTVQELTDYIIDKDLSSNDLFVIAIGTNDIRYNRHDICALTSEEYINRISKLVEIIKEKNSKAEFVFIAPWISFANDLMINVEHSKIVAKNIEYTGALQAYCKEENYVFINPNPYIEDTINRYPQADYLVDWIHPNMNNGIYLYSEAVLTYSE